MPNFGIFMFLELACRLVIQFSAPSRARALVWFSCCAHPCKHKALLEPCREKRTFARQANCHSKWEHVRDSSGKMQGQATC